MTHTHLDTSHMDTCRCLLCKLDMHIADGELVAVVDAGQVLYEEPPRCLHRTLMHVHGADICSDCGAAQRWVVQVWPEVE